VTGPFFLGPGEIVFLLCFNPSGREVRFGVEWFDGTTDPDRAPRTVAEGVLAPSQITTRGFGAAPGTYIARMLVAHRKDVLDCRVEVMLGASGEVLREVPLRAGKKKRK
jgi:hypothetical protein